MHSGNTKKQFLEKTQLARQSRLEGKAKEQSAITVQAAIRKFLCKARLKRGIRSEFDVTFTHQNGGKAEIRKGVLALQIFKVARKFLFIQEFSENQDCQRFQTLCKVILYNLEQEGEPKFWYMSVLLCKEFTVAWMQQLQKILSQCCRKLREVKVELQADMRAAELYLSMLVAFTDCTGWKILQIKGGDNIKPAMQQLCGSVVKELVSKGLYNSLYDFLRNASAKKDVDLNTALLSAALKLWSVKILTSDSGQSGVIIMFILKFLAIPGIILHCQKLAMDSLGKLRENSIALQVLQLLSDAQNMKIVFHSLEGNKALCFLGNIVSLLALDIEVLKAHRKLFLDVTISVLNHCQSYVSKKQSNLTKWHPLLGWFKQSSEAVPINDAMCHVTAQLKLIWKQPVIGAIFGNLPETKSDVAGGNQPQKSEKGLLKRALSKSGLRSLKVAPLDVTDPTVVDVCCACELYRTLINTLSQVKLEIMTGISLQETLIVRLWLFLYSLGSEDGLKSVLNHFTSHSHDLSSPLAPLLILFCECCAQLIPIIDEEEIYALQKPFSCDDLVKLASFLNSLVFRLLWNEKTKAGLEKDPAISKPEQESGSKELLNTCLLLLMVLYDRDSRRAFSSNNIWVIKELKISNFREELDAERNRALTILKKIPHVLPFPERVRIFHEWIEADKEYHGISKESTRPTALITVRRQRVLEDGYQQLSNLSGQNLKGLIRVKFINMQGLDEAGIDQDGVFKEFLEDTIKQAFDPHLNLFKITSGGDERLYPSTTSFVHENHIQLFEFFGKMLGKAVYEGILVEVPFASFFLSRILNRPHSMLYSSIDELPSLDPEMAKSLNFIKNYDGDVEDLELTFSFDEDVLGKVVTHDLKPGGRAIKVTNSNKLTYVHLMAHFRLYTHIKDQTTAFVRGFRSVISPEWLSLFSTPELQRLISGDTGDIDLDDLKRSCRYYGGYHPGHHVIMWLWDIVEHEFDRKEKGMFLKFVTSCSRPPLLGFKHLEPPFSIRFVECSEEEDSGDTLGSVMRGFLNIRRKGREAVGRLPTASTCFNLLKLPGYRKKATLREKLRYSISSGAGFELS